MGNRETTGRVRARRSGARRARSRRAWTLPALPKCPSGVRGLDEIMGGGLPRGRPTLVCGGAGCGKTLFAMEFLVRGAAEHGEPGVFMSFEESDEDLVANVASLGFDLRRLEAERKIALDHVRVERSEIEETGEYDLEGLFVRLQHAIDSVGAKRVALDTIESLFSSLPNDAVLRTELRRLFRWLKDRDLTVVITGERGDGGLTRQGLEEYVSDCVIFLDHRVTDQLSTRRLRIVKYRGSTHGTNEYPFLVDESGISVLPITSLGLEHQVSSARVSTGVRRLDEMLGGKGFYRGTTVLVSGTAGTGKTTLAAHVVRGTCARGERCTLFAFEESAPQLVRNMRSVGIDLAPHLASGVLRLHSARAQTFGLEAHLLEILKRVEEEKPALAVLDPITNLVNAGTSSETRAMLVRLIDFLKSRMVTAIFTSLAQGGADPEATEVGISSLIDTWIGLETVRSGGERNRTLTVIKSRGMAHSNQAVEFLLTRGGLVLLDTYSGSGGVLTGSARLTREAEDRAQASTREEDLARNRALRDSRRRAFEARVAVLREEWAAEDAALERGIREQLRERDHRAAEADAMRRSRHAFDGAAPRRGGRPANGGAR